VATAGFHRDRRVRREPRQKLAVHVPLVLHAHRLARLTFFVHCNEHGKFLVCVASDKLFHIAAAPPKCRGFARSLRETPLQRFHSINIGRYFWRADRGRNARHSGPIGCLIGQTYLNQSHVFCNWPLFRYVSSKTGQFSDRPMLRVPDCLQEDN